MDSRIDLFAKFGGIRPMARAIRRKPARVQHWKKTRRIPAGEEQENVLHHAQRLQLDVTAEDVVFPFPEDRQVRS